MFFSFFCASTLFFSRVCAFFRCCFGQKLFLLSWIHCSIAAAGKNAHTDAFTPIWGHSHTLRTIYRCAYTVPFISYNRPDNTYGLQINNDLWNERARHPFVSTNITTSFPFAIVLVNRIECKVQSVQLCCGEKSPRMLKQAAEKNLLINIWFSLAQIITHPIHVSSAFVRKQLVWPEWIHLNFSNKIDMTSVFYAWTFNKIYSAMGQA